MLSAVARYKKLLSSALARYFPRTAAYLRAEREGAQSHEPVRRPPPRARAPRKPKAPTGKPPGARQAGSGLYPAGAMKIGAAPQQAMRERVAAAVRAGLVGAPSDEQWAMILCRAPLARIFAGAGSGKSSTLVLRVVFLLCHLELDPQRLTVISFTKASCAELRERLQRLLAFWEYPHDVRACVRTFHAAMAALAREQLGPVRWFEQLDEPDEEPDNPLAGGRLRPAQQRLLRQAYEDAYAEDARFRQLVHRLFGLPTHARSAQGVPRAPLDACKLPGEFAARPLFELLHGQIDFAESLGIRLEQVDVAALDCPPREREMIEAMQIFQRYLGARLQREGLSTFNRTFAQLAERLLAPSDGPPGPALRALGHLLIDEFQDISPLIVRWLQAVHRHLQGAGERIALMAIGDDWQSIYGWRGSSPELFLDFDRHFPRKGKGGSATLWLTTNYRSVEAVIRDGERVLAGVRHKQDKTCAAARAMQPGDHGVKLIQRFDLASGLPRLIDEIHAQCAHTVARGSTERTAVLLLSRRNEPLQQVRAQLPRHLPVKALTIHRAKGLQAEVAVILDDCLPTEPHPLRNALYAHCGFFANRYDQAMQDEALRLAYVAITRGVSRVLWYTRQAQGAAQTFCRNAEGRRP